MLLFKFFLDFFFFFFFYGKQIATPSHEAERGKPRPDGRSWLSALRGCHQRDGRPPDPQDSWLGTAREPGQPPSAWGVRASPRFAGLLSLKASLHRPSPPSRHPCREVAAGAATSLGSRGQQVTAATGRSISGFTPKTTRPSSRARAGAAQTLSPTPSLLTGGGSGAAGMSKPLPVVGARQLPGVFDASRRAQGAARHCL